MSIVEQYQGLAEPLKHQLNILYRYFTSNQLVRDGYRKMMSEITKKYHSTRSLKVIVFQMAVLKMITTYEILTPYWVNKLVCYSDHEPHTDIELTKIIKTGKHAVVIEGVMGKKPVIVKHYQSAKRDIKYEIKIYQKLKDMECKIPWFSTCYYIWNTPILVLEKLMLLTASDNEYKVGIAIIKQLWYVHQIGVHSDIKPQNIMKRKLDNGEYEYLLIDYGGVTLEKLGHGYRRWVWSPKWTSQTAHEPKQITTAKNDFIELGYTMKAIQNWKKTEKSDDGQFKKDFTGVLKDYMDRVERIDIHDIKKKDYVDLLRILKTKH